MSSRGWKKLWSLSGCPKYFGLRTWGSRFRVRGALKIGAVVQHGPKKRTNILAGNDLFQDPQGVARSPDVSWYVLLTLKIRLIIFGGYVRGPLFVVSLS